MAKSSNPVDAHRKAQRAKELKKNKQNRSKAKEISTVKKDTRPLEQEIRQLSSKGNLSKQDKDQLASLRAEVSRINKAKTEYVEAHPEHRKFVFPERPSEQSDTAGPGDEPVGLYDKNGRLKHPERSVYYDPVFNPYGAPPPGMPYREKPEFIMQRLGIPTPEELAAFHPIVPEGSDGESDDDGSDDDDIEMPAGPPPASADAQSGGLEGSESDSDDDDDIPLPPGPPPPKAYEEPAASSRVHIPRPSQPRPRAQPPPPFPHALPARPAFLPPPPNAPTGPRNPHQLPSRPAPPPQHMSDPMSLGDAGPQRAFQQGATQSTSIGPQFPPPPPQNSATISAGPSPFLPIGVPAAATAASSSATISAAPQLRDLKKEATAFLPAAMRKKQQAAKAKLDRVGLSKVDAARADRPATEDGDVPERDAALERGPSLMESLKAKGVGSGTGFAGSLPPPKGKDEDYRKFEQDMAEFL
ncbi:hypothetical protein JCM3766R1_006008 [Sporobolomyces carnicolor]